MNRSAKIIITDYNTSIRDYSTNIHFIIAYVILRRFRFMRLLKGRKGLKSNSMVYIYQNITELNF